MKRRKPKPPMTGREVLLTHRACFSASHYYYVSGWSEAKNRGVFGKSANRNGHGHHYAVEVTLKGAVDPQTGMVINIHDLKTMTAAVLEELDHKNLNREVPHFASHQPTPENIASYLYEALAEKVSVGKLESVRVFEDEDLSAECRAAISLSRTVHFSAAHRLYAPHLSEAENEALYGKCANPKGHGHNYTLEVSVSGTPHPETGTLMAAEKLDSLLKEKIVKPWDHRNLDAEIPEFKNRTSTGENLAHAAWEKLKDELPGVQLVSVKVGETPNAFFEYRGNEETR